MQNKFSSNAKNIKFTLESEKIELNRILGKKKSYQNFWYKKINLKYQMRFKMKLSANWYFPVKRKESFNPIMKNIFRPLQKPINPSKITYQPLHPSSLHFFSLFVKSADNISLSINATWVIFQWFTHFFLIEKHLKKKQ